MSSIVRLRGDDLECEGICVGQVSAKLCALARSHSMRSGSSGGSSDGLYGCDVDAAAADDDDDDEYALCWVPSCGVKYEVFPAAQASYGAVSCACSDIP
jgi:hypothetical protein